METLYIIAFEYRPDEECHYKKDGRPNGIVFYTESGAKKHLAKLQKKYSKRYIDGKYFWNVYPVLRVSN